MSGQPPTTFLHLVCLTSVFLLGSFSLLAFGEPLVFGGTLSLPFIFFPLPLITDSLRGMASAAGLLWLADSLEHNPVGARRWGRGLVYVHLIFRLILGS